MNLSTQISLKSKKVKQTSIVIDNILKFGPWNLFMWFTMYRPRKYQQSTAVSLRQKEKFDHASEYQLHRYYLNLSTGGNIRIHHLNGWPTYFSSHKTFFKKNERQRSCSVVLIGTHLNCGPCYFSRSKFGVPDSSGNFHFFKRMISLVTHVTRRIRHRIWVVCSNWNFWKAKIMSRRQPMEMCWSKKWILASKTWCTKRIFLVKGAMID